MATKLKALFTGSNGATSYTADTGQTATFGSNCSISTTTSYSGPSSFKLTNTLSFISFPDSADWVLGADDFTIQIRVKFDDVTLRTNHKILSQFTSPTNYIELQVTYDGTKCIILFDFIEDSVWKAGYGAHVPIFDTNWHHIVWMRKGAEFCIFLDGVPQTLVSGSQPGGPYAIGTNVLGDFAQPLRVGNTNNGGAWALLGYMDDLQWDNEALYPIPTSDELYGASYGAKLTGSYGTKQVVLGKTHLKNLVVTSGSAAAGSVVVATGTTAVPVAYGTFNAPTASRTTVYPLGAAVDGIVATLSATDVIAVFNTE